MDDLIIKVIVRLAGVYENLGQRAYLDAGHRALLGIAKAVKAEAELRGGARKAKVEGPVHNAREVIECGKDHDLPAQQAIREALSSFGATVSLVALDAVVGDGNRGSRAAIALIQQGLFDVGPGDWIGDVTELRNLFTK